jgi:hypothetical protein
MEVIEKAIEELYTDLLNICQAFRFRYDLEAYHIIEALNRVVKEFSADYE